MPLSPHWAHVWLVTLGPLNLSLPLSHCANYCKASPAKTWFHICHSRSTIMLIGSISSYNMASLWRNRILIYSSNSEPKISPGMNCLHWTLYKSFHPSLNNSTHFSLPMIVIIIHSMTLFLNVELQTLPLWEHYTPSNIYLSLNFSVNSSRKKITDVFPEPIQGQGR